MNELSTIIVAADRRYTLANATQLALFTPSTQNTSYKLNFFHCLTKSSKDHFSPRCQTLLIRQTMCRYFTYLLYFHPLKRKRFHAKICHHYDSLKSFVNRENEFCLSENTSERLAVMGTVPGSDVRMILRISQSDGVNS